MRAAASDNREQRDLSMLIREFDKTKGEILAKVDHLNHLAQQIDRQATDNGDSHIALMARGTTRHLVAMGAGLTRLRSLRTAERTNTFRREDEQREQDYRKAAKDALAARRSARRESVVVVTDDTPVIPEVSS